MNMLKITGAIALLGLLGACSDAGNGLIAQPNDTSFYDRSGLPQKQAAIAYDPDGCQNWIIDDGAEGYASRRRDPKTGLPVCNSLVPPGTVVNEYQTNSFPDILPN